VRPERFELPTFWFVARRSIQLSYGRLECGCLSLRCWPLLPQPRIAFTSCTPLPHPAFRGALISPKYTYSARRTIHAEAGFTKSLCLAYDFLIRPT
jgi:hypothetical protein